MLHALINVCGDSESIHSTLRLVSGVAEVNDPQILLLWQ